MPSIPLFSWNAATPYKAGNGIYRCRDGRHAPDAERFVLDMKALRREGREQLRGDDILHGHRSGTPLA